MNENEHAPVNGSDIKKTDEFRVTRDTAIGTLVTIEAEAMSIDGIPQLYSMGLSAQRKPFFHAIGLKLISSEPPLPGHPDDVPDNLFTKDPDICVGGDVMFIKPYHSNTGQVFTVRTIKSK